MGTLPTLVRSELIQVKLIEYKVFLELRWTLEVTPFVRYPQVSFKPYWVIFSPHLLSSLDLSSGV